MKTRDLGGGVAQLPSAVVAGRGKGMATTVVVFVGSGRPEEDEKYLSMTQSGESECPSGVSESSHSACICSRSGAM